MSSFKPDEDEEAVPMDIEEGPALQAIFESCNTPPSCFSGEDESDEDS